MSDNRTAGEILRVAVNDALYSKDERPISDEDWSRGLKDGGQWLVDAMEEYASQQTARLREENERLQTDLRVTENVRDSYKKRLEQLQEEVEQLRGRQKEFGRWLMNIGISGRTFEQLWSEFEALSSKESKTEMI